MRKKSNSFKNLFSSSYTRKWSYCYYLSYKFLRVKKLLNKQQFKICWLIGLCHPKICQMYFCLFKNMPFNIINVSLFRIIVIKVRYLAHLVSTSLYTLPWRFALEIFVFSLSKRPQATCIWHQCLTEKKQKSIRCKKLQTSLAASSVSNLLWI